MQVIRSLLGPKKYVIVVEHDLAVLDYLSDFICCLYGKPGAYGVVTMPFSVREGINIFLAGFVPTENLRFREEALTFKARFLTQCYLALMQPSIGVDCMSKFRLKDMKRSCVGRMHDGNEQPHRVTFYIFSCVGL